MGYFIVFYSWQDGPSRLPLRGQVLQNNRLAGALIIESADGGISAVAVFTISRR